MVAAKIAVAADDRDDKHRRRRILIDRVAADDHVDARRDHRRRVDQRDTGVGPAIASGSHVNNGICADFPVAPIKRRTATDVTPPAKIALQPNGS